MEVKRIEPPPEILSLYCDINIDSFPRCDATLVFSYLYKANITDKTGNLHRVYVVVLAAQALNSIYVRNAVTILSFVGFRELPRAFEAIARLTCPLHSEPRTLSSFG